MDVCESSHNLSQVHFTFRKRFTFTKNVNPGNLVMKVPNRFNCGRSTDTGDGSDRHSPRCCVVITVSRLPIKTSKATPAAGRNLHKTYSFYTFCINMNSE